jgi:uncharacterized membrane protein
VYLLAGGTFTPQIGLSLPHLASLSAFFSPPIPWSASFEALDGGQSLVPSFRLCSNLGGASLSQTMEFLVVLLVLLLIATPILAIVAIVRVQRLNGQLQSARLQDLIARLYSLEQQLTAIERAFPSGATPTAPVPPSPQAEPPRATPALAPPLVTSPKVPTAPPAPHAPREAPFAPSPSIFAAPPLHRSDAKPSSSLDLETLIAGRWLNRIGIVAVIVAVSFFLKYAFDNHWIGPSGRVAMGILLGAAMLPWSHWLLGKGYPYFSEGIAGLGQATLLLSVWAGCRYYTLFSRDVGFAGMIVITAVMAAIALGRNSERIALLSLLGGFLTPLLLSTGKDEQVVLFTYLLILGAGLLIIAARRDWRSLTPVAFALTQIYFWGWYDTFYRSEKLERTIIFATLFFLLYATLPVLRAIRISRLDSIGIVVVLANSFAYLAALYEMLWPQDRWPLTLLVLALSGAHVAVARLVPPPKPGESPLTRLLFAGLALTFVTLAIPIRLEGKWITLAFAIEGAILVRTGFRSLALPMRSAGYFLLALAAIRLVVLQIPAPHFLFNARFGTYLVVIACLCAALFSAREHIKSLGDSEENFLGVLAVAINVYALIAVSLEFWDYFGHVASLGIDRGLAQHLALSLLWTAYASALILVGVKRHSALLRWQALVLFGLVVVKVFFYDSSYLERLYRIISFLILGVVLLVVSFLYQRKVSRERSSS